MKAIPRIRGRVGTIEEPENLKGQFCFEVSIWNLAGTVQIGDPIGPFGPFKTELEAQKKLKEAVQLSSETCERADFGETSGKYYDLLNGGVLRNWQEN